MISSRQRALLAALFLSALLLVGYYSVREPTNPPPSNTSTKIAQAKERLQQNVEEQNKHLKQALAAAKASLKSLADAPAAAASTPAPPSEPAPSAAPKPKEDAPPDSTGFAYIFYATTDAYACSVLVNIHRLTHLLHTTIPIHVLASPAVSAPYLAAPRAANATLHVQDPPPLPDRAAHYYRDSLLKLRAFGMHKFAPGLRRVMVLDADQLVLRNVDALFWTLPDVDLAAPRAYWLGRDRGAWLSSTFMLIGLSDRLWGLVEQAMQVNLSLDTGGGVRYDIDLVNAVLGETAMVLGGEFACLNSHWEDWNLPPWYHAERELNWTTIGLVNGLARVDVSPGSRMIRREGEQEKRQIFKSTDLPPAPTPALLQPTPQNQPLQPTPRFPLTHPLALELQRLHSTGAALLHFSAVGKPWTYSPETVAQIKPDAHPLLAEQFGVWRAVAGEVCPGGLEGLDEVGGGIVLPESLEGVVAMATGAEVDGGSATTAGFGLPVVATAR